MNDRKSKKTSILFTRFPYASALGGEELHTLGVAEKLAEKGFEISLMTSDSILVELFKNSGLQFQNFKTIKIKPPVDIYAFIFFTIFSPVLFLWFSLKMIIFTFDNIGKERLIYMLSLPEKLLATPFGILLGNKVFWLEHARIGKWWTHNPWRIIYSLLSYFVKIIAPSMQTTALMRGVKNIHHIPHGLHENSNLTPTENKDGFNIICIARLSKDKGVDVLINAFDEMVGELRRNSTIHQDNGLKQTKINSIKLQIIGTGLEEAKIRALTNQKSSTSQIQFFGKLKRKDIWELINSANVLVLPSTEHDPFGLVCLEGMSLCKPVVATKVCGISDFVNDDEIAIIPENDVQALKNSLIELITNEKKRTEIAENGYRAYQTKFSHSAMIENYEKLFNDS